MRHLILLLLATSCATAHPSSIPSSSASTRLNIENLSQCDLNVRVLEEGMTRGLYRVNAYGSRSVVFAPVVAQHALTFRAEPVNGCGAAYTIGTLARSFARMVVRVGAHAGESTVAEIDASP